MFLIYIYLINGKPRNQVATKYMVKITLLFQYMKQNAVSRPFVHGLLLLCGPLYSFLQPTLMFRPPWRVGQYSNHGLELDLGGPGLTEDLNPQPEYLTRDYKP